MADTTKAETGITLEALHRLTGEMIANNTRRGWAERNEKRVAIRIDAPTRRGRAQWAPIDGIVQALYSSTPVGDCYALVTRIGPITSMEGE